MIELQMPRPGHRRTGGLIVAALLLLLALAAAPSALAETPHGYLQLATSAAPSNLPPGGKGKLLVTATNLGDAGISGGLVLTDRLPAGLSAVAVTGRDALDQSLSGGLPCALSAQEVSCTYSGTPALRPLDGLLLTITVKVAGEVTGTNRFEVSGASTATAEDPVKVSAAAVPFGIERYELKPEVAGGAPDRQAGSHPFQLTTALALTDLATEGPVALTKNLQFSLPPGLIGNPNTTAKCRQGDFDTLKGEENLCGPATAVGEAQVTVEEPGISQSGPLTKVVPIFNLEPAPGEPARFGFSVFKDPVVLDTAVRTGSDYGVVVAARSTSQRAGLISSTATFWGTPADPVHNLERGWACTLGGTTNTGCAAQVKQEEELEAKQKGEGTFVEPKPFLQMPTSCGVPLGAPVQAQSWVPGAVYQPPFESQSVDTLEGCDLLGLNPVISVEPESHSSSTPTALTVKVAAPQKESEGPGGEKLVESAIRSTTVALPEGMQLNPAAAGGLLACSSLQVGFLGAEEAGQTQNDDFSPEAAMCPEASEVGTVSIKSPDLEHELEGFVYLASQDTNPFKSPLVLYLIARDPASGVLVKLAGSITPNPVTGQVVSTFENTPQVPFEELTLKFFKGGRASQSTPDFCGSYATASSFTPWSGGAAATPSSSFAITSGPGGGACPSNPLPFTPGFEAGSTNVQAGAFTPFALTIKRPDGNQALEGLTMTLPPGMAALLASVTPCPEPQAANNECGPESLIGHSISTSGLGGEPFTLAGQVFLTGPYKGGPFGLSVVTPAIAGPFNLGDVTVRSRINVDPSTAAVTVTSDPFPTILKGVPTQLKQVSVVVDRPGFQFNPTSCDPMAITGSLLGSGGTSVPIHSNFQVANCASLPFTPKITSTVGGQGSKVNGASLNVTLESPGLGQANIHKVDLTLPKALPSRLDTIQKACTAEVFEANPAACDEGSVVGEGIVHTPVFKNPLRGPAYLVGHGGAAFPDVEFVLQGEGVTIILDGKTFIEKGVTFSRFETSPDAPFTKFESKFPTGPHSALGVESLITGPARNLCKVPLSIPVEMEAQNGALIKKTMKPTITGCKGVSPSTTSKLTRAQQLKKALKACKRGKKKAKRAACEKQARKKFGPKKPAKKKKQ